MSIVVITGLLSDVLGILTTTLALVQTIAGAEAATTALTDVLISVTQAIGILNALPPITIS